MAERISVCRTGERRVFEIRRERDVERRHDEVAEAFARIFKIEVTQRIYDVGVIAQSAEHEVGA